jgi:nitrate reductase NapE component
VALAIAWAVYLIPKAIEHHHAANTSRTVDRFSHTLRVLARREPVSKRRAQLVRTDRPGADAPADVATDPVPGPSPAEIRARREAARRATKRRRRVLSLLLLSLVAVAGVAAYGAVAWAYAAIPGGLLVAWLAACRLRVQGEHRSWDRLVNPAPPEDVDEVDEPAADDPDAITEAIDRAVLAQAMRDPAMWDPVPVTLPTYVSKPVATRSVRTIDLESSGVWTSGRTEGDAAIAREADEAARAERAADRAAEAAADEAPGAAAGA